MSEETLFEAARRWCEDDPDPLTRAQLEDLLARASLSPPGSPERRLLADCFAGLVEFGTAGLRAPMGPGPNRMNRSVVIRAAVGLAAYLTSVHTRPTVVIGYDARHGSQDFALDTAAVFTATGATALLLPRATGTPVLAYAIRRFGADAGVMVTASHNPPQDNGYKVYLGDGAQIIPPVDQHIREQILRITATADVARADAGWRVLDDTVVADYLAAVTGLLPAGGPREVRLVHTALHGLAGELVARAFPMAGFAAPTPVASQAEPDPDFPTTPMPNPEEPGTLDAAFELARSLDAQHDPPDAIIAHDPDADRCAVAVPDPQAATRQDPRGWRLLRGDELGVLLAVHLIDRGLPADGVLACSIVSSRLLAAVAGGAGLDSAQTLTGFKWIARAPGLVYGYEEAFGYCVAPDLVRDKDGISASLLVAEYLAGLRARGLRATDMLDEQYMRYGVHATDAFSVPVSDLAMIPELLDRLRAHPPAEIGGTPVRSWDDLGVGVDGLPPTEGLRYYLIDDTRVILRPSGTEPKLKVYLEAIVPVHSSVSDAKAQAAERLVAARAGAQVLTATPPPSGPPPAG